jgi:hypothetical protein
VSKGSDLQTGVGLALEVMQDAASLTPWSVRGPAFEPHHLSHAHAFLRLAAQIDRRRIPERRSPGTTVRSIDDFSTDLGLTG